jgi:hypothetical protein
VNESGEKEQKCLRCVLLIGKSTKYRYGTIQKSNALDNRHTPLLTQGGINKLLNNTLIKCVKQKKMGTTSLSYITK